MPLRVTFDTNVLDQACRPSRFPKDPLNPKMQKVHDALLRKELQGFFSICMLTIEGIQKRDRGAVFAGTTIEMSESQSKTKKADLPEEFRAKVLGQEIETISVNLEVQQLGRSPLHPEFVERVKAARSLGVKALAAVPRVGSFGISDPNGDLYLDRGVGKELGTWLDKAHEVTRAIENRGVGFVQLMNLGLQMGSADPTSTWFDYLDQPVDIHQERQVERAFAEWADADSIAAHIAYGIDIFCSADVGNSNATNSVLDAPNRSWLETTYGVRFMTLEQLANHLA